MLKLQFTSRKNSTLILSLDCGNKSMEPVEATCEFLLTREWPTRTNSNKSGHNFIPSNNNGSIQEQHHTPNKFDKFELSETIISLQIFFTQFITWNKFFKSSNMGLTVLKRKKEIK